jgi:tetratricopeptide (TPR) repeat protein
MKIISTLRRVLILILAFIICLINAYEFSLASASLKSSGNTEADHWQTQGLLSFQRGDFEQAASYWQEAVRLYEQTKQPGKKIDTLIQLANAYQSLGQPPQSEKVLKLALDLSDKINDQAQITAIMGSLGNTYFMMGEVGKAKQYFELGNAKAREIARHDILSNTLNNLGNMLTWQAEYREALNAYDESFRLTRETSDQVLAAKILVNAAKAATHWKNLPEAETYLDSALKSLDDTHNKANGLIALGHVARIIQTELPTDRNWRFLAYQVFNEAANIAEKGKDRVTLSYALGYLGKLYEDEGRIEDALNLTRRALFLAQQINSPEILYQWHWQIGRLLRSRSDIDGAISAYRHAITNFQWVRQDVSIAYQEF